MKRVLALLLSFGLLAPLAARAAAADQSLPDLERGIAALEAGQIDAALADLLPLARRGYGEAQIRLARLYATRNRGDDLDRAIHWYWTVLPQDPERVRIPLARALLQRGQLTVEVENLLKDAQDDGDPDALALRLRLYLDNPALSTPEQVAALAQEATRGDTVATAEAALRWYRDRLGDPAMLADAVSLCSRWLERIHDCYAVLARSHRAAGDDAALDELIGQLRARHDAGTLPPEAVDRTARRLISTEIDAAPRARAAYRLFSLVAPQLPQARTQMGRLLIDDASLAPEASARELLQQAMAEGDPRAAYYLGRLLMDPDLGAVDPQRAHELLIEASTDDPAAHFYLGRLYDRGYLGRPDKPQAAAHYLRAARSGYAKADLALAHLYWDNEGVRPDPVNAYCFARLAYHAGVPGSEELIVQLHAALDRAAEHGGQQKAEVEFAARQHALGHAPDTAIPAQLAEATP